jgi:endoglycosylceramidase
MRSPLGILAALALAALALPAAAGAAVTPLRVRDGRLLDRQGREVVLRGMNVVYKLAPYLPNEEGGEETSFNARDAARLQRWGFNTIRLGVSWRALEPERGVIDRGYIARYRRLVDLAGRFGIYVLVDMHQDQWAEEFGGNGAPPWATITDGRPFTPSPFPLGYAQPAVGRAFTSFWENRNGVRTEYVRAFAALARALRRSDAVLGYDAFNEPSCEIGVGPCTIPPGSGYVRIWLQPFYDELVPALRRADPLHPTFYEEGTSVNSGYPFRIGVPPNKRWPFRNTGLSFHVYCQPLVRADAPCSRQEREALRNGVAHARRTRALPLMTEFGATERLEVLRRVMQLADDAGIGWHYWQYKTYDDPTTSAASESPDAESVVTTSGLPKEAKLRVLARPYPQSVAGRSARWSFDDVTGRFSLRWTARRGNTVVAVPVTIHYRRGYRVRVVGGLLDSEPGARLLRVRTRGGRVSLVLAPAR